MNFSTMPRAIPFVLMAAILAAQTAPPKAILGKVTGFKVHSHEIGVEPDTGAPVFVKFSEETEVVRIAPGEHDLTKAAPAKITDIHSGDRLLVSFADGMREARRIVLISAVDIVQRNEADRLDWQNRGVWGVVTAKSGDEITLRTFQGAQTATVTVTSKTKFRRYAPDSIKFENAQPSALAEIAKGDQVRARGQRSEDALKVTAEVLVFGTFMTAAGDIKAVNPAAREITMNDVSTGKHVTVRLIADSLLKGMPEFRPGGEQGAAPHSSDGPQPFSGPGGMARMLDQMPAARFEDLKVGGAVTRDQHEGRAERTRDGYSAGQQCRPDGANDAAGQGHVYYGRGAQRGRHARRYRQRGRSEFSRNDSVTGSVRLAIASLLSLACAAAQTPAASLRGAITDPSGAAIPGAMVELRGPRGEQRTTTDGAGAYLFPALPRGKYQVRFIARGFSVTRKKDFRVDRDVVLDAQLAIQPDTQVVNVEDEVGGVNANPAANGGAAILHQRQLAALSDDPDELAQQLQALAGPIPGPGGAQFYIDGFLGGILPPKAAIREIRINANPFSPEYDRPGFARIEIFTKPGSDSIRGQAFVQFNDRIFNSRNPLLEQSMRPPYRTQFYGFNLSGPLRKNKASFTLDVEHRRIDENAFILATTLDDNLNPLKINQAVLTPQTRTSITPRLDYTINPKNTLVVRYQDARIEMDNQGIGDFNLATRAYNSTQAERTAQVTETAMIGPRAINETRLQFMHARSDSSAIDTGPGVNVQGAFYGGGPGAGNSGTVVDSVELTNTSTFTRGAHTIKWGGRVRNSRLTDTSRNNFAGTFTFFTLDRYRETLALEHAGYTDAQIAQLGAGPSQFSLNAGTPQTRVGQADLGLFVNDDWRARPHLTLSYGLRYEAQTNAGGPASWAPRVGIAWSAANTVLRAGFGTFYDRIPNTLILNARRYDGTTQQSYLIANPPFYREIPPAAALEAGQEPQQLRPIFSGIVAPRLYQTSLGIDRRFYRSARLSVNWIQTRGVHLLDARNINAPVGGAWPYGDRAIRVLTESAGLSRLNQLVVSPTINYRKLMLFGFYSLSYGRDNNEGMPADPYNLRAEWGPSSYGDVRHRMILAGMAPLPLQFSVMPFFAASSGQPYNITTGLDPNLTGFPTERPALVAGPCEARGCFDANPAPGMPVIGRNSARGPSQVNLGLRLSRTWAFGGHGETGPAAEMQQMGSSHGMPAGPSSGRKYNLTFSASTFNALNHANFAPPEGDLSSPYFGQYRGLADLAGHMSAPTTFNRKISLQVRFTF